MTGSRKNSAWRAVLAGIVVAFGTGAVPASAGELQISGYSGYISSPHSHVDGVDSSGTRFSNSAGWEGKPFEMPPFWGVRATYWMDRWENWGIAADFAHTKVYAELGGGLGGVYETLEFTDGLNLLTANVMYRYPTQTRFTPYVGVGAGIAVPHVEVDFFSDPVGMDTFEYQVTGPAVQGLIGVDIAITENISTFVEYKGNYSWNKADLAGGGSLETNILSNQFIVGLSYTFKGLFN